MMSSQSSKSKADCLRAEGNRLFQLKQYEGALRWYTKAIAEQRTAIALSNRAQAQLELGNPLEAFVDTQEALDIEPGNFKALYRKGVALMRLGRLEFSKDCLKKCAEIDVDNKQIAKLLDEIEEQEKQQNAPQQQQKGEEEKQSKRVRQGGLLISTDTWRELFHFIRPEEGKNLAELSRLVYALHWDHYFARAKRRKTHRLTFVRDGKNGEMLLVASRTKPGQNRPIPFATDPPPPNIRGLELSIQSKPGPKLLQFLAQCKEILVNCFLKFEGFHSFLEVLKEQERLAFMKLFQGAHFVAIWAQMSTHSWCEPLSAHMQFSAFCYPVDRLLISGGIGNQLNTVCLLSLIEWLHFGKQNKLRVLCLDDDWLTEVHIRFLCKFRAFLLFVEPDEITIFA